MKQCVVNGKPLSNFTLGTVQLGVNYGIANNAGKPSREKSFEMLRAALAAGVTSLDTASAYGDAEDVLGMFFAREQLDEAPFVTTKFIAERENPAQSVCDSLNASLKKLQISSVDAFLMHRWADMEQYGEAVPDTLAALAQEGKIGVYGPSVYRPEEIDIMFENPGYQAIQIPMNLFDQKLIHMGYLDEMKQRGITVFVRSVFLQGLFFLEPDEIRDPLLIEAAVPHLSALRRMAEQENMSVAQFAISFIRDIPGVTSLVLGADTPAQIQENVALMEGPAISEAVRKEAAERFRHVDMEKIMSVLSRGK